MREDLGVHGGEQQHREPLRRRGLEQQLHDVRGGGDGGGQPAVERRGRALGESAKPVREGRERGVAFGGVHRDMIACGATAGLAVRHAELGVR